MIAVNLENIKETINLIYNKNEVPKTVFVVMGDSGIGKTEMMEQVVKDMSLYEDEARVINCAHLNLEDMGLPDNTSEGSVKMILNDIFVVASEQKNVMVILDELNRPSNDSVFNFLMGMVSERRLFGTKISDKIRFVATMNPNSEEYCETQDIFADIASRRRYNVTEMKFDTGLFLTYHKEKMHKTLHAFLSQYPDQILVKGKLNCPRMWERFNVDIMKGKSWKSSIEEQELAFLKRVSSLYMDNTTLGIWSKFVGGSAEKFISGSEILTKWTNVKAIVEKHVQEQKIDLINASCTDLVSFLAERLKIENNWKTGLHDFLILLPKSLCFSTIQQITETKIKRSFSAWINKHDDLMAVLASGTIQND